MKRGSLRSSQAITTIRRICTTELAGRVELKVVDIELHPEALEQDHILAIPTLVKRLPKPLRRIVGDLTKEEVVRAALDITPLEDFLNDDIYNNETEDTESSETTPDELKLG